MDLSGSRVLAGRAPELLLHYGMKSGHVVPLPGWNNPVVRVESPEGTFALRWHEQRGRSESHIRGELEVLRALADSGLRVPRPFSTRTGDVLLVSGGRLYDLTSWLPGEVRRKDLAAEDAHILGRTLADLHQVMSTLNLRHELPRYFEPFSVKGGARVEALAPYFAAEDMTVLHDVERRAKLVFAERLRTPKAVGIIHNDFILGNCLWQGRDMSVLDFADCGIGLYLYDLAPMLTNLDASQLQTAFVAGYASKRPLDEKALAPLAVLQAVRHVRVCLTSVATARRGDAGPPLAQHLASRLANIHELLA